ILLALGLAAMPAASGAHASAAAGSSGKQAGLAGQATPYQQPSLRASAPAGSVVIDAPSRPNIVLYDQYDNLGGSGINSQHYETSLDIYDDQAADDFVVCCGGNWTI